ncbi:hypothetical protein FRC03_003520 [Tulasnella sp. 419]|nr:hypothetical protein FRC03_003520 [Tulasnella sp. 419]
MAAVPYSLVPLPESPTSIDDLTPLLVEPDDTNETSARPTDLDLHGLRFLLIQHLSSAWVDKTVEFASYVLLIEHFRTTLLPSSIYGFSTTCVAILFSRWAGSLVDHHRKLEVVRAAILVQKTATIASLTAFLFLFTTPDSNNVNRSSGKMKMQDSTHAISTWVIFYVIVFCRCIERLSTTTMTIAVERDWPTCISECSERSLSLINTWLRRIDLTCQLLAPLFVSFLTSILSYKTVIKVLLFSSTIGLFFEMHWIKIVYSRFPALQREDERRDDADEDLDPLDLHGSVASDSWISSSRSFFVDNWREWNEFVRLPVFLSSLSISFLYLTVLSFDGTMLGFLKTRSYSDAFLAEMRGLGVIMGLLGTLAASPLEARIGSIRAGNWSIWSEVICLVPVLISFYIMRPTETDRGPFWVGILLFGGMAASRVGLWTFDLIQTKQLQTALASHPKRNTLTSLQIMMQNTAEILKYVIIMVFSKPSEFRWAALASFISVLTGAISYAIYVRRERGHLVHCGCMKRE